MDKLTKDQRIRLDKVMEDLYPDGHDSNYGTPKKEFRIVSVPEGSLIITPRSMSKKDFQFFMVKWMDLMEERIKKRKLKAKRKLKTKRRLKAKIKNK